jgi:plasmid stability protein
MNKVFLVFFMLFSTVQAADFKAGVGRKVITPKIPLFMSGYASRNHCSEGVLHDLWAKAVALDDGLGGRVVLIGADVIAVPREIGDEVAERLKKSHGLRRSQVFFNASHTHCGPFVWPSCRNLCDMPPQDHANVVQFSKELTDHLTEVAVAALKDLIPAQLSVGHGTAGFAINRRQPLPKGVALGVNPKGPVDHDVPVLKVCGPDGRLRAVIFGYACHNTTLGGDFYQFNGDYAGFAQIELEKALPGTTALFLILCGADQNPHPRGKVEHAAQHGQAMAAEVRRVLNGTLKPLGGPLRTAYTVVNLDLAPHQRANFEEEAQSTNVYKKRRAMAMLQAYDQGKPIRTIPCPVQAIRWDGDLALLAIGGEVVVDFALRMKREFKGGDLIVAGYTNDVPCYISSRRVIREGGYEPVDSMIYYGQPGPLSEKAEEQVIAACRKVLARSGETKSR